MLVLVPDSKIAPDGAAGDGEAGFRGAWTSCSSSLHASLHGGGACSSRGPCSPGPGLLHLRVAGQGGTPGALGGISGDDDVRPGSRVAAGGSRHLHSAGGLPEPLNGQISMRWRWLPESVRPASSPVSNGQG